MNVPERDAMGKGIMDIQHHYATCNLTWNEYNHSNIPPICRNFTHEYINDNDVDTEAMEKMVSIIVPIFFGIIIILGFFGNALVVVVVAFNQQMRSTTNLLIINLAIADLLFIVCCVPFTATDYVTTCWPFGDVWCKIVQYLIVVTAYASVYTLVLMSLDRFLAVVHPIASMSVRTERNALKAILITWVVIVLMAVPVFNMHGEVSYTYASEMHTACVFLDLDDVNRPDGYNKTIFQVFFFLTSYLIPLLLIVGLYLLMLMRLWRGVAPGGHVSAESRRGKRRVTRMVVVVVAIFAFCWCPIQVILLLKSLGRYEISGINIIMQIVSQVLAYMNSCVNPILYAFLSEHFRKSFRKVIRCGMPDPNTARHLNGRADIEKSALTKTTRTGSNDIL